MKSRSFFVVLSVLCLCLLVAQAQAGEFNILQSTPLPETKGGDKQDHNVWAVGCYMSNYTPFMPDLALGHPATYFTDDAQWSNFIFSISVEESPVPAGQVFAVVLFFNMDTGGVQTANIGVNAEDLLPGYVYSIGASFWDMGLTLTRGARYAVNVYLHPMGPSIDVQNINNSTWFITTFY